MSMAIQNFLNSQTTQLKSSFNSSSIIKYKLSYDYDEEVDFIGEDIDREFGQQDPI